MRPGRRATRWLNGTGTGAVLMVGLYGAAAAKPIPSSQVLRLGSSQMVKLVIAQPLSSNRLEYDAIVPLHETDRQRYFLDAKVFVEQRPLSGSSSEVDPFQAFGQSARLGVRSLLDHGQAFWGASAGYDSLWRQGVYFQQAGLALEYTSKSYQWVLTAGLPFPSASAQSSIQASAHAPLASVNVQLSLPTGAPGLSVQPRVYVVGNDFTGSALGGQLQFTYSWDRTWSATLASSYDALTGASGSLTFQVVLPQRSGGEVPAGVAPDLVNSFAGAVGNNGSRVIRLDQVPSASGN